MRCLCEVCGWAFENFKKEIDSTLCTVCGSNKLHELSEEEEKIALNGENTWKHCEERAREKGIDINKWNEKKEAEKLNEYNDMIQKMKEENLHSVKSKRSKNKIKNIENIEIEKADKRTIFDYMHGLFDYMHGREDIKRHIKYKFSYLEYEEIDVLMEEWSLELDARINIGE